MEIIDKKITISEVDKLKIDLESDLISYYQVLSAAVDNEIKRSISEGLTPEQLIENIELLFEEKDV